MTDWKLVEQILASGHPVEVEVRGTSMYPSLFSGEKVLLRPMPAAGAEAGKCYLTRESGVYRLHRALRTEAGIATMGDNLEFPDPLPEAWIGELAATKRTLKGTARRCAQLLILNAEHASLALLLAFVALMGAALFPFGQEWKAQVSDLALLGSLLFALASARSREAPPTVLLWPLGFAGWCLVSALATSRGWPTALGQLELALLPALVCFHARAEKHLLLLMRAWCVSAAVLCLVAVAGVALEITGISTSLGGMGGALGLSFRPRGLSLTTNLLASLALAPTLFLFGTLRSRLFSVRARAALLAPMLVFFGLSVSRTLLALAVGALLLAKLPRAGKASGLLALCIALFLSVRFEWGQPGGNAAPLFSEGTRWQIHAQAVATFLHSPIFGAGPGETVASLTGYASHGPGVSAWHAHNTALDLLATTGAPGFLLFCLVMGLAFRRPAREGALGYALTAALGAMLFDSLSVDSERFRHLWLLVGLCFAAQAPGKRSSRPNSAGHSEGSVSFPLPFGRKWKNTRSQ